MSSWKPKELDTIKTQLYTNITHEFRTPLTAILGMAQQVIEKPGEQFETRMDMIARNSRSLLNLVNQLLDLSKLETGKIGEPVIADKTKDHAIEDSFVRRVREAIEQNLTDINFTVDGLSKFFFMSHSQLHRKLDALTGCSPNKFIRMIRLKKAKELLQDPSNSIASVALDCGYNDPGYFGRVFKQEYGVTPQEWRGTTRSNS